MFGIILKLLVMMWCVFLFGCVTHAPTISPEMRTRQVDSLAKTAGWQKQTIHTRLFTLKTYGSRIKRKTNVLTIYIEGDGLSWISEDTPSDNPTPIVPIGFKMAIHDPNHFPVAYLARPCQFVFNEEWAGCRTDYWTNLRFSPEVVNAMNEAVSYLKKYYHAKQIILIGYSGGGTIAALITARRTDIVKLITIAAVLDIKQWERQENLTPLNGSLNPADEWKKLVLIPQTHWVGGKDTVVPKEVAFAFANRFPANKKPEVLVIPAFNHTCCWAADWATA
jgi:hypothetical protein